ncbi:hypothetical protein ABZ656_55885, partial [Streptomyces sp. NPDC007095]|uniref:hypothetical protein n=1 Tax=Streptomyces sp. NPDC007095 TaxID=3154482 RepID=UPI0033C29AF9
MVRVGSGAGGAADRPAAANSPVGASARAWRGRFRGHGVRRRAFSGLGEDGPTHQPVEHLASLRAIPGLN